MSESTAEKPPVTIVGLHASNFKRLVAVDIEAAEAMVTVGGQNEAGKSSVLDAVAVVLGGAALAPKVPIRKGQKTSEISVDLGDMKIVRKFSLGDDGRVTSTLTVTNADGSAAYRSPQAILDKLLGGVAFHDPLAFTKLGPTDRREAVRRIVGLDFSVQDARRRKLLDERLGLGKRLESAERSIEGVAPYADAPAEEIDPVAILKEIETAEHTHEVARAYAAAHVDADRDLQTLRAAIAAAERDREEARLALLRAEDEVARLVDLEPEVRRVLDTAVEHLKIANDARVPVEPLRARMAEVAAVNKKVQHNDSLRRGEEAVDHLRLELATVAEAIALIDAEKREALEKAPFPVPGMSFTDDDVLLDGLPFDQASTARKLRVSVAMALARAGQLRVLLVKAGNDLDQKNLALLADLAREHRAQVWVERVTDDPSTVTVFIEDGAVRR